MLCAICLLGSLSFSVFAIDEPTIPSGGTEIGSFTYPPVELPFSEPDSWYGLYFQYPSGSYSSFTFIFDFPDLDAVDIDVLYSSTSSGWTLTFNFVGYKDGDVVSALWDSDEVYIWRYYAGRLNPCDISLNGSGGGIFSISDSGSAIYQSWHSSDTAKIKIRPATQIGSSNMSPPVWLFGDAAVTYRQFIHVKQTISYTIRVWFEALFDNLYSWFYDLWYEVKNIFNGLKQWFATLWGYLDTVVEQLTALAEGGAAGDALKEKGEELSNTASDVSSGVSSMDQMEQEQFGKIDANMDSVMEGSNFSLISSPLLFVSGYISKAAAAIPGKYLTYFTLPMFLGIFFFIVQHKWRGSYSPPPSSSRMGGDD